MSLRLFLSAALAALLATTLALAAPPQDPEREEEIQPTEHPFLWRVELGETSSYLYGTIHIPDDRVLTLPEEVAAALDGADAVYTEVPLNLSEQLKVARLMLLPGGEGLSDVLPEELFERLSTFLEQRSMPMAMLEKMKPWVLAQLVELADYLEVMQQKPALDQKIWNLAKQGEKRTGGLETVEEQVAVFDHLSYAEQAEFLEDTLDRAEERADEEGQGHMEGLIELYLAGDLDELQEFILEELDLENPLDVKLNQLVLVDRNHLMVERMIERVEAAPERSFFFAVGAAHYPGEEGILALLAKQGYKAERISPPPVEPEVEGEEPK